VRHILEEGRKSLGEKVGGAQIAFFGGSFTAIPDEYRRGLLEAARPFLGKGGYGGIRISTRPDGITRGILSELKDFGVSAIELGAQSMDDRVLEAAGRGHTAAQTLEAARLIKDMGFSLGLQMMTHLPGDSADGALLTAQKLIEIRPDSARIYPTIVFEGTGLAELYKTGDYSPATLEDAVSLCAKLLLLFTAEGINVIRVGLHADSGMANRIAAGPYHPAFRELAEGEVLLDKALHALKYEKSGRVTLSVEKGARSKMAGQNRRNIEKLKAAGYTVKIEEDSELGYLELVVESSKTKINS